MTEREWQAVDALARDEWRTFQARLKAECEHMASVTPLDFRYRETVDSLTIQRFEDGVAYRVLSVRFEPAVPRIAWDCQGPYAGAGWATFRLMGSGLLYVVNNVNTAPPDILMQITRCLVAR